MLRFGASRLTPPALVPFELVLFFPVLLFLVTPQQARELLQKGLMELQQGNLAAAQADLEQASAEDPQNAYIWSALAEVYLRDHQAARAGSAAKKAEEHAHGDPVVEHALALYYSRAGDYADAARDEEIYAGSVKADRDATARAAAWYLAAGNSGKATALAKQTASNPDQAFQLAQLFLRDQQFGPAAEIIEAALGTHPDDAQLVLALGVARYGQRRFEEAITAFLKVIHLSPGVPQPYLFLSRMLDQAGPHLPEIVSLTREWADKNPDNAGAQLALAKALLASDPASHEAETLLRRSIALNGNDWDAHYQLGVVLEQAHQYPAAADQFQQAITLRKSEPMPHYQLARVYDRLGKPDQAAAERAIHNRLVNATEPKQ